MSNDQRARPTSSSNGTYRASIEVWGLWTTKDGFEVSCGPQGFRVEVQELDARLAARCAMR